MFDQEQFNWADYLEEYGIPHLTTQDTPPDGDEDGDYGSDDSETLGSIVDQFSLDDASSQKSGEKFDKLGDLVAARAFVGPPESNTTAPSLLLPRIEITDAESQSARMSAPSHPSPRTDISISDLTNHLRGPISLPPQLPTALPIGFLALKTSECLCIHHCQSSHILKGKSTASDTPPRIEERTQRPPSPSPNYCYPWSNATLGVKAKTTFLPAV